MMEVEFNPSFPTGNNHVKAIEQSIDDTTSVDTECLSQSTEDLSAESSHREETETQTEDMYEEEPIVHDRFEVHLGQDSNSPLQCQIESISASHGQALLPDFFHLFVDKVRFCLEKNEYHLPTCNDLTDEEYELCWYTKEDTEKFREDMACAARSVFLKKKSWLSWLRTDSIDFNEDADSILNAYDACMRKNFADETSSPRPPALRDASTAAIAFAKHEEALCRMYSTSEDLYGLEHFAVTLFRGGPQGRCRFVLEQGQVSIQQRKQEDEGGTSSCINSINDVNDKSLPPRRPSQEHDETKALTLAHVSQCISRPSRIFAHEMAKAQAKAMTNHEIRPSTALSLWSQSTH